MGNTPSSGGTATNSSTPLKSQNQGERAVDPGPRVAVKDKTACPMNVG